MACPGSQLAIFEHLCLPRATLQEETLKLELSARFRRLYVLHHCTVAWAHTSRQARDERQQQREEQQRRARISTFLSRITAPEGPQADVTSEGPASEQQAPSVSHPAGVSWGQPSAPRVSAAATCREEPPASMSGRRPALRAVGPKLSTAARAESKRQSILAAAEGSRHLVSGEDEPGSSAGPGQSNTSMCGQGLELQQQQQPEPELLSWRPGQTFHLIKKMKQQLMERHLIGVPPVTEGGDVDKRLWQDNGSLGEAQPVQPCSSGEAQPVVAESPRGPAINTTSVAAANPSHGAAAGGPVLASCGSRLKAKAAPPPPPRPRRTTTGCIPASPSSVAGAVVGVRGTSKAAGAVRQDPTAWGLAEREHALARVKASELQKRRKTTVSSSTQATFGFLP